MILVSALDDFLPPFSFLHIVIVLLPPKTLSPRSHGSSNHGRKFRPYGGFSGAPNSIFILHVHVAPQNKTLRIHKSNKHWILARASPFFSGAFDSGAFIFFFGLFRTQTHILHTPAAPVLESTRSRAHFWCEKPHKFI